MPSFFLALILAASATLGGREAVRAARLGAGLGTGWPLLLACWLACIVACALAAWLGGEIAEQLAPEGKTMLVAIALLLAALEVAILRPGNAPVEPTRSFGAIAIVLGAAQLTSATGLLVLALSAAKGTPWLVAAGGAIGSAAVLSSAVWAARAWEERLPLNVFRFGLAGLLGAAAVVLGLWQLYTLLSRPVGA